MRYGDNVIACRGLKPEVALFAHIDTTGFTLGYESELIPIGSPTVVNGDSLRPSGSPRPIAIAEVKSSGDWNLKGPSAEPGSRYVYSNSPEYDELSIKSPYLDNRAGVYAALQCLSQCNEIAVAFTTGEEHSGSGAYVCAGVLYRELGITQALISDITWHTDFVKCGNGVAVSLRDRTLPRQRFLDRVLDIAGQSGIPFQREIESSGGSDGGAIQRSGNPIDWVFVGAPEKDPHTSREELAFCDLTSMTEMLGALVRGLTKETEG
jgi:putative aminopeptidase FrvX